MTHISTPLDTLQSIRKRRSIKALSDTPLVVTNRDTELIEQLLESAYWAPFHYPCHRIHKGTLTSDLPFRCYVLDSQSCRNLATKLTDLNIQAGKIVAFLNTADYLIQTTWTPQNSTQQKDGVQNGEQQKSDWFEPSITNMEHIAAASSAIQNILLTATALGHENYWSSGGVLRDNEIFELLGIPPIEILLGSLFLFPSVEENSKDIHFSKSKRRNRRGKREDFYQIIEL